MNSEEKMAVWDPYLSARDRLVYSRAGYGSSVDLGSRPALVVVDINYDFIGDRPEPILESIERWPNSCGEEGWRGLAAAGEVITSARECSVPVIYTTSFPRRDDGVGDGLWRTSRVAETRGVEGTLGVQGSQIPKEIEPQASDIVIYKDAPSAFFGTRLLGLLLGLGVDTLLVCGASTSGCVRATVVDAFSYNFVVGVVEEATFDRGELSHAVSLFDMDSKYAELLTLQRAKDYLQSLQP